ncbi:hypothetical protein [Egibacter rhizosphaerae]|uniref:hypothetical protein n=1 Tax=Egibacter rhizosphaerae TaxID=1670831 RepID=UPI0013F14A35|nr:hypothetical protein [Egibacter rhizosphaerae]
MADYYWCFAHDTVEEGPGCRGVDRLGPYESPEAARGWRQRVERRNREWDAADRQYRGS